MQRLLRIAILSELIDQLKSKSSWCGETHIQKAVHLIQEVLSVPLGYEFILYKHGPFSFDLRDELSTAKADNLLDIVPQAPPYGPSWITLSSSVRLRELYKEKVSPFREQIRFVAEQFGSKDVSTLERLATALFVLHEDSNRSDRDRAKRIHALKPHITVESAEQAICDVRAIEVDAQSLRPSA